MGFGTSAVRSRGSALGRRAAASGALILLAGCSDPAVHPNPVPVTIHDPYAGGGTWYKANLHLHSTHSHGLMTAAELAEAYRSAGYGAIAITDHNQYGDQDGGRLAAFQADSVLHDWNNNGTAHPEHIYGSGVEAYVRDWTVQPPDYCKDRWFRPPGTRITDVPIVLSGFEASWGYFGAHFGLVGFPPGAVDPPQPGYEWLARSRDAGGFAYIAHPGDANGLATRFARGLPLDEFEGLEIMNGVRLTGAQVADATPLWDSLLTQGHVLWGLANDDAHQYPGAAEQYPFVAFDVVLCLEPTAAGFLDALHRGAFYASTGLEFQELRLTGATLEVRVPDALQIRAIGSGGRVLQVFDADHAEYAIAGDAGYVRIEARGGPVVAPHNTWMQMAWSQPFRVVQAPRRAP